MAQFDVAISFAGEDRPTARQLAHLLKEKGLVVFYDDDEQAQLLGENLTEYLVDIYKNRASHCVVLVSSHYVRKRWTRHEWRAAQARAFEQFDSAYILPIRLDDSDLPGLLPTVGYLSLRAKPLEECARIVYERVASSAELNHVLRIAEAAFDRADFATARNLLREERLQRDLVRSRVALHLLGHANLALGYVAEALDTFRNAADRFPDDADSWFFLGVSHFRLGRFRDARRYYERALQLSPHHQTAYLDLKLARLWSVFERVPFLRHLIVQHVPATMHIHRKQ